MLIGMAESRRKRLEVTKKIHSLHLRSANSKLIKTFKLLQHIEKLGSKHAASKAKELFSGYVRQGGQNKIFGSNVVVYCRSVRMLPVIPLGIKKSWQSIETLTEALQKWMPRFLANSFLALNSVLKKHNVLFLLKSIKF